MRFSALLSSSGRFPRLPPWLVALGASSALLLVSLPALWPALRLGLTASADGLLHVLRIALLATYQREALFFPRWMPDLVLGYGYPLLSFYGPSTYFLASLFVLAGADPALALWTTLLLLLLLAGAGVYLLLLDLVRAAEGWRRHAAALVGATGYLYAPYLLINLYARGAVAEVGAQMLLPWILWALRRIFYASHPAPYLLIFALTTALLALTHNISLLFMPPVLLLFALALFWQTRHQPHSAGRLGLAVLGALAALGVSSFFWLPLVLERSNLAETAFQIAARYVGENTWTLENFLDLGWPYTYSTAIPFRLGAVQLLLAVLGFVLLPRRSAEWWLLLAVLLGSCLLVTRWALPLWLGSDLLLIAQFPWRLLAVASLPLALFPAGIVLRVRPPAGAVGIALGTVAVIVAGQHPSAAAFRPLLDQPVSIGRPAVAQFELQTRAYGTSSSSEFLPRWAGPDLFGAAAATDQASPIRGVQIETASPVQLSAVLTNSAPIDLKFTQFYFPGWSATVDGQQVSLTPDPARGLLSLALPAGSHRIAVAATGTALQQGAAWLSLATLGLLAAGFWLAGGRRRWLAAVPALCLLAGGSALLLQPRPASWQTAAVPAADGALELLGYHSQITDGHQLQIFPYWLVHRPVDGKVHWQLVDSAGVLQAEQSGDPFFNTLALASLPATTLFDDAYQLTLPPGLTAGTYTLRVAVAPAGQSPAFAAAGSLQLPAVPAAAPPPLQPLELRFGNDVLLDGWRFQIDGRTPLPVQDSKPFVVRPGQLLEYTLFWRADNPAQENYHGFIHLLDAQQQTARQHDKTAGSLLAPARLWNEQYAQADTYRLEIDSNLAGGLYWPSAGLYRFDSDGQRLPITDRSGRFLGTEFSLPPVKILNSPAIETGQPVAVQLGEWGELQGYSIEPASSLVAPGATLTLTLVYRARGPAPASYTRFLHIYDPDRGMVAQQDAPPLGGGNPTQTWVADEQIVETMQVAVAANAQPGPYTVWFGFYDPDTGQRVPLLDRQGALLVDSQLALTTLQVAASSPP